MERRWGRLQPLRAGLGQAMGQRNPDRALAVLLAPSRSPQNPRAWLPLNPGVSLPPGLLPFPWQGVCRDPRGSEGAGERPPVLCTTHPTLDLHALAGLPACCRCHLRTGHESQLCGLSFSSWAEMPPGRGVCEWGPKGSLDMPSLSKECPHFDVNIREHLASQSSA